MRADEPVREQVQPQIDVVRVDGRLGEAADGGADRDDLDATVGVRAEQCGGGLTEQLGRLSRVEPFGAGGGRP